MVCPYPPVRDDIVTPRSLSFTGEQFASDEANHVGAVRAIFTREDLNRDRVITLGEFTGPKTDEHMEL